MQETSLKLVIRELTEIAEKADKQKIDYLKDVHSMFAWSLVISSAVFLLVFGNDFLKGRFESKLIITCAGVFVIQALSAFLHRIYNGSHIDNFIFRITYLNLQRVYLEHNLDAIAPDISSFNVLDLNCRIQSLEFIGKSGIKNFPDLEREMKISKRLVTIFGVIVMLAFVVNACILIYGLLMKG